MAENIYFDDLRTGKAIDITACSGIGKRESQQDSAYWHADDQAVYAVLCDGMGGLGGGEIASKIAVESAKESYKKVLEKAEENSTGTEWMLNAIVDADRKVYQLTDADGKRLGAGSTMASVWIKNKILYWASAGDSRVFVFRNGEMIQLTTDLNYFHMLDEKMSSGEMTESEYQKEAETGEALISFLGLGNLDMIDRNTDPLHLEDGDVVMLCSDGVYRTIDAEWMSDILFACDEMENVANFIPMIIDEHGSEYQDNYTCILIKFNSID